MSRARADATSRARGLSAAMVGAVLALLLPSLLTTPSDAAGTVTLAVLTLALAGLVVFGIRCVALARTKHTLPSTADEATPALPGRATDPVHHPLRPRAPGLT